MFGSSRRRPRAGSTLTLLATTLLASAVSGPQAVADAAPVGSQTTVYSADGTAASTSGLHNGTWDYSPLYGMGSSGAADDQSFLFDYENYWTAVRMDSAVSQFGTDPFAVSFKIRTTATELSSIMGARDYCGNPGQGWFDVRGGSTLLFEVGGDHYANLESTVAINDGEWHTVALHRTSTAISITVDGTTASLPTPPSSVHPDASFGLNNSPCTYRDQTVPFIGELDDIHLGSLDVTAPVLAPVTDRQAEATGPSGAEVTYAVSATDDTDPAPRVTCSPASGSTFAIGITPVTCTATDETGNAGETTFNVQVTDSTAPVLNLPDPVSVDSTSPSGTSVQFSASATDLVDGHVTPSCQPASGTTFTTGNTKVTCTANDAAGNSAEGSFTVTVRGAAEQAMAVATLLEGYDRPNCAVQAAQAYASLERGQQTAAKGQLGAVRNCTAAAVRSGRLTAAQGSAVNNAIARILATLG